MKELLVSQCSKVNVLLHPIRGFSWHHKKNRVTVSRDWRETMRTKIEKETTCKCNCRKKSIENQLIDNEQLQQEQELRKVKIVDTC